MDNSCAIALCICQLNEICYNIRDLLFRKSLVYESKKGNYQVYYGKQKLPNNVRGRVKTTEHNYKR